MTNDYLRGWRKKLRWDRNQRRRRSAPIRRKVRAFKENPRVKWKCRSRARTAHGGPLVAHHVGGLSARSRLAVLCEKHNQEAAGNRARRFNRGRRRRPGRRRR